MTNYRSNTPPKDGWGQRNQVWNNVAAEELNRFFDALDEGDYNQADRIYREASRVGKIKIGTSIEVREGWDSMSDWQRQQETIQERLA